MWRRTLGAALVAAPCACGQSFNIDLAPAGSTPPPDTYAGAGAAGHWMSVPGTQGVTVFNLVDSAGQVTGASFSQIGGTETLQLHDAALQGDDATLMNGCLITHSAVENCIFLSNMEPGTYDVIIYARMPAQSTVMALTNVDQEAGNPHHLVGGAWPGHHDVYVSYAWHLAEVAASGPQAGKLWLHSGVAPGGSFTIGAALNGFQVYKRPPCSADVDASGTIDVGDLVAVILAWGACSQPFCPADTDGDGDVDVADLVAVILAFGPCV